MVVLTLLAEGQLPLGWSCAPEALLWWVPQERIPRRLIGSADLYLRKSVVLLSNFFVELVSATAEVEAPCLTLSSCVLFLYPTPLHFPFEIWMQGSIRFACFQAGWHWNCHEWRICALDGMVCYWQMIWIQFISKTPFGVVPQLVLARFDHLDD